MTVKKTILCVGDEQSLSIQKVMLETRGYRVMTCNTAVDALRIFDGATVDMVLSNARLPDATAADLAIRIKSHSSETPVVLLNDQKWILQTDSRVDLVLRTDTYTPAELLEHIRILLTRRRGPHRAVANTAARGARAC